MTDSRFLLDPLWPLREVHILTGESGVGKTTLLTQWVNELVGGGMILGHKMEPQSVVYVSNERSQESLELDNAMRWKLKAPFYTIFEAMKGVGVEPKQRWSYEALVGMIKKFSKDYRVVVIDPIVTFCPKPNDQNEVHRFLYTLAQTALKEHNVTVIATGHPPKEREGSKIMNIRQKVAGSHGWGSFSNCNMHMEPADDDNRMASKVRLEVRGRHSAPLEFYFDRSDDGKLIEVENPKETVSEVVMDTLLAFKAGKLITTKEAVEYGEKKQISKRSVERWLQTLKANGVVEQKERGEWLVMT